MYKILLLISLGCLATSAQLVTKTYRLTVTADVTLERGGTNFNYLQYLIVGTHPGYPLKRSLMRFQNVPRECSILQEATLHLYFVYAHKASAMTAAQVPAINRYITAHTVLKSWVESQATSTLRFNGFPWVSPYLHLGADADHVALSSTKVTPFPGGKWVTLDVIQQAQAWQFGRNYGLLLRDTHEALQGRDFRFASNAYGDKSKHAYITIKCLAQQQRVGGGVGIITPVGADGVTPI